MRTHDGLFLGHEEWNLATDGRGEYAPSGERRRETGAVRPRLHVGPSRWFSCLSWSPVAECPSTHVDGIALEPSTFPLGALSGKRTWEMHSATSWHRFWTKARPPSWPGLPGPGSAASLTQAVPEAQQGPRCTPACPQHEALWPGGGACEPAGGRAVWEALRPASPGALAEEGRCPWACGRGRALTRCLQTPWVAVQTVCSPGRRLRARWWPAARGLGAAACPRYLTTGPEAWWGARQLHPPAGCAPKLGRCRDHSPETGLPLSPPPLPMARGPARSTRPGAAQSEGPKEQTRFSRKAVS